MGKYREKSKSFFLNRNFLIFIFILVGLMGIYFIYKYVDIREVILTFRNATLLVVLLYVLVQIILMFILTWRWKMVLDSQGIKHIGFRRLNSYRLVGQGVSFLTPSGKLGGEPVRAGIISRQEGIDFNKALAGVVVDRAIDISTAMIFFVLGTFILLFTFVLNPWWAKIILFICLVFLFLVFYFHYRLFRGKSVFLSLFRVTRLSNIERLKKFEKNLENFEALVIKFYHKDRKYFYYTLLISALLWSLMFVEYKLAGLIVGHSLTFGQSFLVISFIGLAYMLPVPMALGTLEASQLSAFAIMGASSAAGVALSFLVRFKDLVFAMIGVFFLGKYGFSLKDTVKKTKYINKEVDVVNKSHVLNGAKSTDKKMKKKRNNKKK